MIWNKRVTNSGNDDAFEAARNRKAGTTLRSSKRTAGLALLALGLCLNGELTTTLSAQTVAFAGAQSTLVNSGLGAPEAVAVDRSGNVYIADAINYRVLKVPAGGGSATTVFSTSPDAPTGIAVDGAGNIYLIEPAQSANVVKYPAGGGSPVLLGTGIGYADAVATDEVGDVFIADFVNRDVVMIPSGGGAQTTIVGGLNEPNGVAVDGAGDVFVSELGNSTVVKVPAGGGANTTVGTGLGGPLGVAADYSGNVFILDGNNNRVVKVPAGGGPQVTISSGLLQPQGVAVDAEGRVFITEDQTPNLLVVQTTAVDFGSVIMCPNGQTTQAPCGNTLTLNFYIASAGDLTTGNAVTMGAPGLDFWLATGGTCSGHAFAGSTCSVNVTFAPEQAWLRQGGLQIVNSAGGAPATVLLHGTGMGSQVVFNSATQNTIPATGLDRPASIATDGAGNIYIADAANDRVVEVLAAGGGQTTVGTGLIGPQGVALDGAGDVFIADLRNDRIVEVPAGGGAEISIGTDLSYPAGVAVDAAGNLFVADSGNQRVVEFPAGGGPETTVGAGLGSPFAVAVDSQGDLFVADLPGDRVIEVPANGGAQVEIGSGWNDPAGVFVDGAGDLFVADEENNRVVEFPSGGGAPFNVGTGLNQPRATFVNGGGDIFIADTMNNRVIELPRAAPPTLSFANTEIGSTSTDSPQTIAVESYGNQLLTLTAESYPADFPIGSTSGDTNELCSGTVFLLQGWSCDLPINFTPKHAGALTESLTITDNALNATSATQSITLTGTGRTNTGTPATLTTPAPGSTLASGSVTFTWTTGVGVTNYQLWLGTSGVGSSSLYNSGAITATSANANIPAAGVKVYARLYSEIGGVWKFADYTYTETGTPAALTAPKIGSTFTGTSETFTWKAGMGVTNYQLWLGTSGVGSANLYNSGPITALTSTVTGIPAHGVTVYARLYSEIAGAWKFNDYTFTEVGTPAVLTEPRLGSTLAAANVTFAWTPGSGVTHYQLWLGASAAGSSNVYNSGAITATTVTVPALPGDGTTLYARLYSETGGVWSYYDYTFVEPGTPAFMMSPTPGSTLGTSNVRFTWTAGIGNTDYQLWLSASGPGSSSLYNSGSLTTTYATVTTLPATGGTIYARLYSESGGVWQYHDYTYVEK